MPDTGPRIFISYRRSDRALAAHWLYDKVAAKFGKEAVFFDVHGLPAGFDYRDLLMEQVSGCDVLLAVIGDDWLDVCHPNGQRRLESPNDPVRIEIEAALQRKIPVIPVLVETAQLPSPETLPMSLQALVFYQARELRSGLYVEEHFRLLNESIEEAWRIHCRRAQRANAVATTERAVPQLAHRSVISAPQPVATASRQIITNSIGLKLALIPAGSFWMGSPESEAGRSSDESPRHEVKLTRNFSLGVNPVTQAEYQQVVGSNPSRFAGNDRRPVERVSWLDAVAFCNRLSEWEQRPLFYNVSDQQVRIIGGSGYRLPTEAEWEYACRAGTRSRWWFGDEDARLRDFAWYGENSGDTTHPVGEKPANAWGLHDMHGNVWEWCQDWYDSHYYAKSPKSDPVGPDSGPDRVSRGGAWGYDPDYCRSAYRYDVLPDYFSVSVGFRVASA